MFFLGEEVRKENMTKGQTHYNQQITTKTKKLLEKLCQRSKLSKPMQLEMIVEVTYNKIFQDSKHIIQY